MLQSSNKNMRDITAFLYERLSRDDDLEGESYSIANQKQLLTKIATEKGYTNLVHFCDDGVSGVSMNRPQFNEMIKQLELGKASAVFVKDLSRLGRNYIAVGKLTEEFFPDHDIRLVAVSDNIDTAEGENEMAPIRNLFNEWYSRDISKKRRISNKIRGSSGEPLGFAPYGYMKDPDNPKRWIIDGAAASVVRQIYDFAKNGMGTEQIAVYLTEHKVLTPMAYAVSKGFKKPTNRTNPDPYHWNSSTITKILNQQEYCGDVINFKTYSKSYKNKKRIPNSPENMMVFEGVHEPIIEREVFEAMQRKRNNTRKRKTMDGERNMFSGILVCADCGSNMQYHFNQKNPDIKYFNCYGYNRGKRKICNSTHYIRVDFLEQVVLGEIKRLIKFASQDEDRFISTLIEYSKKTIENEQNARQNELKSLIARHKDLDFLYEKIYEDNAMGKISDERFAKLAAKYEDDQKNISRQIDELKSAFEEAQAKFANADTFRQALKKYTRIKKLTPNMLNELIDRIEVHQVEKIDHGKVQKLVIYYNCIGLIYLPEDSSPPTPDIHLQTRKGVTTSYGGLATI